MIFLFEMWTKTHVEPEMKKLMFFVLLMQFDNWLNVDFKFSFEFKFVNGWISKNDFNVWDTKWPSEPWPSKTPNVYSKYEFVIFDDWV